MEIGKKIKTIRSARKMSARNLAVLIDLDPSQISKIENGASKPSLETLEKICNVLNITLSDFFKKENDHISKSMYQLILVAKDLTDEQIILITQLIHSFKNV